jgi:hypothetical protein
MYSLVQTLAAPSNLASSGKKQRVILEGVFVLLIVFSAFALRIWGMSKVHFWDEAVYLQNAEVICCDKTNYSELDSRPPLLSLFFAALFLVWHHIYAADIGTALLNALGPALLYLSGRMIVGRIPAVIGSLFLAFSPFFVGVFPNGFDSDNTGNSLLSDSPALTLLLLGFWLLLLALRRQSDWRFACVGFVFSLTVLMRFASLSTIGILSLLIFAADKWLRAAFACVIGFLTGFTPYLCWSRLRYEGYFETLRRGWRYYQGDRQSPLFYAQNFGAIFCWITLVGLALWVALWAWQWKARSNTKVVEAERAPTTLPQWMELFLWVWVVLVLVFFFVLPHQEPRYAMPAAPPLFLLAGSGLSVLIMPRHTAARTIGIILLAGGLAWSFLPDVQRFELPLIDGTATTEEMQVAQYLNSNFPPDTVLYSNFNYPLFGYYTRLRVKELPETGPRLYDALSHLPENGILVAYSTPEIDPRPEWLSSNQHFRILREFPSLVLYEYRKDVGGASSRLL